MALKNTFSGGADKRRAAPAATARRPRPAEPPAGAPPRSPGAEGRPSRSTAPRSSDRDLVAAQQDLAARTLARAKALGEAQVAFAAEASALATSWDERLAAVAPTDSARRCEAAAREFATAIRPRSDLIRVWDAGKATMPPATDRAGLERWFGSTTTDLNRMKKEVHLGGSDTLAVRSFVAGGVAAVVFGVLAQQAGYGFLAGLVTTIITYFLLRHSAIAVPREIVGRAAVLAAQIQPATIEIQRVIVRELTASKADALAAQRARRDSAVASGRRELDALAAEWRSTAAAIDAVHPGWGDRYWNDHALPTEVPRGVRIGTYRLAHGAARFEMPALWTFPAGPSLIIRSSGGPSPLPVIVTRLLATMPAAKAEFTLVDPLGLGETFRPFAHLAEYGPALLGGKVITQAADIDRAVADAGEHIESVNSRYLKGSYRTIEEHNAVAGEVAVPYRFLVVQDFPKGFSEDAVDRLATVAEKGPACGTYVILQHNDRVPVPHGVDLRRLQSACAVLAPEALASFGPDLIPTSGAAGLTQPGTKVDGIGVTMDEVPPMEVSDRAEESLFGRVIARAGKGAREARDVALTADQVVAELARKMDRDPDRFVGYPTLPELESGDRWWSGDSSDGLIVPLGKAGAAGIQCLDLRSERSHVLMTGATGQGKSTLIRTLINTATATYSPEELRLYLVDFKDGVGFKQFATPPHALPHADVVAIKSQREFGISVLEGLVAEMGRRAEAQKRETELRGRVIDSLGAYRRATGEVVPRILVIIDEFQTLFVPDGALADKATALVVDLARKGRSFGIHLFFSTQALRGAGLASDAKEQMMVRIAFRLSPSESELVLTEGNTAAASLRERGVAIYNGEMGDSSANESFRVGIYPEPLVGSTLERTFHRARAGGWDSLPRVFGGDEVAHLDRSVVVREHLGLERSGAGVATGGPAVGGSGAEPPRSRLKGSAASSPSDDRSAPGASRLRGTSRPADPTAVPAPTPAPAPGAGRPEPGPVVSFPAFIGEPLSMDDTVQLDLRRSAGRNLLGVGGDAEVSAGLVAGVALGYLKATVGRPKPADFPGRGLTLLLFDADSTGADRLRTLAEGSGGQIDAVDSRRGCAACLCDAQVTVRERQASGARNLDPVVLVLYGLDQARDLRRSDGYSYVDPDALDTMSESERAPLALKEILVDGPEVGVHVVAVAEAPTAVRRVFDHSALEEFDFRLVHRMHTDDSQLFLDSDLAARGTAQAVWRDDRGRLAPVMPFTVPSADTLLSLLAAART